MTHTHANPPEPIHNERPDQNHQPKRPNRQPNNFKARTSQIRQHRNAHLCITIRWPAAAGQTGDVKLILKGYVPGRRAELRAVGGC
jgi:hypothetical protein